MSRALDDIRRRRVVLQARSRIERAHIVMQATTLLRPVGIASRAAAAAQRLMARPAWMLALAVATLVLRPRRLLAWSGPMLAAWRFWQGVKGVKGGARR